MRHGPGGLDETHPLIQNLLLASWLPRPFPLRTLPWSALHVPARCIAPPDMAGATFFSISLAVIHSDAGPAATAFIVPGGVASKNPVPSRFPAGARNLRVFRPPFNIPDW
jgi:hypothetical protein